MSLDLSLYKLSEGSDLMELLEMRRQLEDAEDTSKSAEDKAAEASVLDGQIALYMEALPTKVDGFRHVWKRIETLIAEARTERDFQARRIATMEADLDRLKDYGKRSMEARTWAPGKPKKLEGRTGAIYLKGNGGKQAVEISDESLVPDEMKMVTVSISRDQWQLKAALFRDPKIISCIPSPSLIGAELERACGHCLGNWDRQDGEPHNCPICLGTGKRSVPGARLAAKGQHVEVR